MFERLIQARQALPRSHDPGRQGTQPPRRAPRCRERAESPVKPSWVASSAARARARRRAGARCRRGKRARSQPLPEPHTPSPTSSRIPFPFRPAFTVLGSTLTVYTKFRWREQLFNTLVNPAERPMCAATPTRAPPPTYPPEPGTQVGAMGRVQFFRGRGGDPPPEALGRRQPERPPRLRAAHRGVCRLGTKRRGQRGPGELSRPAPSP